MKVNQQLLVDNIGLVTGLSVGLVIGLFFRFRSLNGSSTSLLFKLRQIVAERRLQVALDEYKMVMVVNTKLKMEKGKTASQCCHAAVSVFTKTLLKEPSKIDFWQSQGSKKIIVKAEDSEQLEKFESLANAKGLTTSLIRDRGLTQISPGSKTVLGIGPDRASLINGIVGHLKLY